MHNGIKNVGSNNFGMFKVEILNIFNLWILLPKTAVNRNQMHIWENSPEKLPDVWIAEACHMWYKIIIIICVTLVPNIDIF